MTSYAGIANGLRVHAATSARVVTNLGVSYLFYYVVYPFAIWKLGVAAGGAAMFALSSALCYAALCYYDRHGADWFGIELLKERLTAKGRTMAPGRNAWMLAQISRPLALVGLSIKFDPFVTTICMRRDMERQGRQCGMSGGDWAVFAGSVLIGNGYWLAVICTCGKVLGKL